MAQAALLRKVRGEMRAADLYRAIPAAPAAPKGARNKLGEEFLNHVYADWAEHGTSVLAEVRQKTPAIYLRVVASLVPRHLAIETIGDEFDDMTTEELREYLAIQAKELGLIG